MVGVDPNVISEFFFDADGNVILADDPVAVACEVNWLDEHGNEQRTYARLD